jgi:hypothetical protein
MKARHAAEMSAQKAEWRDLFAEQAQAWAEYRKAFEIPERNQRRNTEESRNHARRDEFNEAANGREPHPNRSNGKPLTEHFRDSAGGITTPAGPPEQKRRDWRARRSAAERKADGSYKTRDRARDKDHPGRTRTRERDRYDHD